MKTDNVFSGALVLAPMAGYTDVGFRALALKYGATLTVTEMVSSKALMYNNKVTVDLLKTSDYEKIKCVQLFGHEPEVMRDAAQRDELTRFDIIDINMGCPMPKIFNNGDGSALMLNFDLAAKIIKAVKESGKTVTVKFRTGVYDSSLAVDFAKMCEASGAAAITVHGRTREQYYSGEADRDVIENVCKVVKIPVIGNGDVRTIKDLKDYTDRGCSGVAVGRAAEGRPWIFAELSGNDASHDIMEDILFHIKQLEYLPERVVACEMKKHIAAYLKGIPGYKQTVVNVCKSTSIDEIISVTEAFLSRAVLK